MKAIGSSPRARPQASPLFRALDVARTGAGDVAALSAVAEPTVRRWRRGSDPVPPATLVFLTLVLAGWLREMEALATAMPSPAWGRRLAARLDTARRCLDLQELYNAALPDAAVDEGRRRYLAWLSGPSHRLGDCALTADAPERLGAPPLGAVP